MVQMELHAPGLEAVLTSAWTAAVADPVVLVRLSNARLSMSVVTRTSWAPLGIAVPLLTPSTPLAVLITLSTAGTSSQNWNCMTLAWQKAP